MTGYRKQLIRIVTFLGGIYFFLVFLLPKNIGGKPSVENPAVLEGGFVFSKYHEQISDGFILIGAMAFGLGLINLLMVHGTKIAYLRRGWMPSVALLFGLFSMLSLSAVDWYNSEQNSADINYASTLKEFAAVINSDYKANKEGVPELDYRLLKLTEAAEAHLGRVELELLGAQQFFKASLVEGNPAKATIAELGEALVLSRVALQEARLNLEAGAAEARLQAAQKLGASLGAVAVGHRALRSKTYELTLGRRLYDLLFKGLFISLGAAMFSLLGFYIAAAAYRAFRIRSVESGLMMAAAVLVMLGQIPFGLWISDALPEIRHWLLQTPSAATARAIEIGTALAGLVMAFRMWFSIESESFKGD